MTGVLVALLVMGWPVQTLMCKFEKRVRLAKDNVYLESLWLKSLYKAFEVIVLIARTICHVELGAFMKIMGHEYTEKKTKTPLKVVKVSPLASDESKASQTRTSNMPEPRTNRPTRRKSLLFTRRKNNYVETAKEAILAWNQPKHGSNAGEMMLRLPEFLHGMNAMYTNEAKKKCDLVMWNFSNEAFEIQRV